MVKVHGARRKAIAAVGAWNCAHLVEHLCLTPPHCPLLLDSTRSSWRSLQKTHPVLLSTPDAMAVDADDVALGHLVQNPLRRHQHGVAAHDVERLRRWIAVVEFQLIGCELAATMSARHVAYLMQELNHSRLPNADALIFDVAIASVVLDVIEPLSLLRTHDPE